MDDETILARGGTQDDIREYAKQNGADLTALDVLQQKIRDEFDRIFLEVMYKDDGYSEERDTLKAFLDKIPALVIAEAEREIEKVELPFPARSERGQGYETALNVVKEILQALSTLK